jgi:hypothetical protein
MAFIEDLGGFNALPDEISLELHSWEVLCPRFLHPRGPLLRPSLAGRRTFTPPKATLSIRCLFPKALP